jgi:hypothetical protein
MDDLPKLTGSKPQVDWAEEIRRVKVKQGETFINDFRETTDRLANSLTAGVFDQRKRTLEKMITAFELIKRKADSRWWIDNRDEWMSALIQDRIQW